MTALVFIVGACSGLVQSIPIIAAANAAADRLAQLEDKLAGITSLSDEIPAEPAKTFSKIEVRDVEFHYPGKTADTPFKVGPFNFTLNSGDLVILTGGNGSGKSTFMKILAGFYRPASGELLLDGTPVVGDRYEYYRSLITAIFPDFHLFQRLYGIDDPDPAELVEMLTEFKLQDKTRLTPRRVPDHRPVERPAPAARADRGAAREAAAPDARRMGRRPGSGIPAQVLLRVPAGAASRRRSPWWRSRTTTAISTRWMFPSAGCAWTRGVSLS